MTAVNPYLNFAGNTEEAFNFYKSALGGKITNVQRFGDSPQGGQMADADKKKIMHIALEAPEGVRLMGNDHLEFMGGPFMAGNNFSLSFHPDSCRRNSYRSDEQSTLGRLLWNVH